jgi:hypothetical protein
VNQSAAASAAVVVAGVNFNNNEPNSCELLESK